MIILIINHVIYLSVKIADIIPKIKIFDYLF